MKSHTLALMLCPLAVLCLSPLVGSIAKSDTYPVRPVKIVASSGAGSGPDVIIRIVADRLTSRWGQQVYVENRPGGGGLIAAQASAAAEADGYTLYHPSASSYVVLPETHAKRSVDLDHAFVPIAFVGEQPMVIAVGSSLGIGTLAELIAQAKGHPGEILYAANMRGSLPNMTGELLRRRAGIDLTFVAYPGGVARAMPDVIMGRVSMIIDGMSALLGAIKGGDLRALAVASEQRLPDFPDLPTVAETIPGFVSTGWFVLMAPAGTPQAIIDKVNRDLRAVLDEPAIKERFATLGTYPRNMWPAEVAHFIRTEQELWRPIVRQVGVAQ
jgi:tripartite-type tricarboxylate transporter receptor subunit TctC